ncbi:MAG: hypothetical protein JWR05_3488 [Mucilaginibacter sp.]|nr:hypothetical protein [Mucilaginibacter sp.]
MKNYAKNQYAGNLNKWDDTKHETQSVHAMSEAQAEELNKQFDATGIKYEETKVKPHEFKKEVKAVVESTDEDAPKVDDKPKVKRVSKPKEKKAEIEPPII